MSSKEPACAITGGEMDNRGRLYVLVFYSCIYSVQHNIAMFRIEHGAMFRSIVNSIKLGKYILFTRRALVVIIPAAIIF